MTETTEIQNQTCPKCGEENPAKAVICWACYTPLGNAKLAPIRLSEDGPELRFPRPAWWRGKAESAAQIAMVGALVSSGWWRGKTRFGVLSAGLAGVAIFVGLEKRAASRQERDKIDPRVLQSPICRITDTILRYAIKDKTTQVRIKRHEYGVQVEHWIEGEWRDQMRIPSSLWHSLHHEIQVRAENGAVQISAVGLHEDARFLSVAEQNTGFKARILIEPPHAEILLTRL